MAVERVLVPLLLLSVVAGVASDSQHRVAQILLSVAEGLLPSQASAGAQVCKECKGLLVASFFFN